MAMSDDTGRDAAFEGKVDDYYAALIRRALEESPTALSDYELARLPSVELLPARVLRILEASDWAVVDPRSDAPPGAGRKRVGRGRYKQRWSTVARLEELRAQHDACVRDPHGADASVFVERMVAALVDAGKPLSRWQLVNKVRVDFWAVDELLRERRDVFDAGQMVAAGWRQRFRVFDVTAGEWMRRFGEVMPPRMVPLPEVAQEALRGGPDGTPPPVMRRVRRVTQVERMCLVMADADRPLKRREIAELMGLTTKQVERAMHGRRSAWFRPHEVVTPFGVVPVTEGHAAIRLFVLSDEGLSRVAHVREQLKLGDAVLIGD